MALPPVLASIVNWLRAGYPEGVPEPDYVPLFALLHTRLTDADVNSIADELAASGDETSAHAIRKAIGNVTNEHPSDAEVARVSARLAAGGWPLASPKGAEPAV
jgi:hypothetical protein